MISGSNGFTDLSKGFDHYRKCMKPPKGATEEMIREFYTRLCARQDAIEDLTLVLVPGLNSAKKKNK